MTTITATFDPEQLRVDLVVDAQATGAVLLELRRTDANGAADVRLPTMPATFETFTLADYEVALEGIASYEAAVEVAGVEQRAAVTVDIGALVPAHAWVVHPAVVPEDAMHLEFVDWVMQRTAPSSVQQVIGRPDPVVNRAPLALRAGTLEVWLPSYAEVQLLEALAGSGETLALRQNDFPGLDGYFELQQVTPRIKRDTARPGNVQWWAVLTLVEVARPSGPLLAATSWTWGALLAAYPTWRDVRAAYPTWRAALLNQPGEAA